MTGVSSAPVSEGGLPEGKRGDGGGIGAEDAGAEGDGGDEGEAAQARGLLGGEAALGAGEHGPRAADRRRAAPRARAATSRLSSQNIRRRAGSQPSRMVAELRGFGDVGNPGFAALLGGLDRMGAQTVGADALGGGVAGEDRLDARGAEFGRLLDDEVGARLLDRGEEEPEVGGPALRLAGVAGEEAAGATAGLDHLGVPFAVAAVEDRDAVA